MNCFTSTFRVNALTKPCLDFNSNVDLGTQAINPNWKPEPNLETLT